MKLGIIVVYLVAEEDEKLLELHLAQIQKHTTVPYVIYAGANRLLPRFRARLESHPKVKICDLAPTELLGDPEHAFYLDQLAQIAIDDGATRIVSLHTDSFPIQDGWAEELEAGLAGLPFSTVAYGPYSACLFFRREFYVRFQPRFRLTSAERGSATYRQFAREHAHIRHSGIGFLYRAFEHGLEWHSLAESSPQGAFGVLYDRMVFHLQGNVRTQAASSAQASAEDLIIAQAVRYIHKLTRIAFPKRVRQYVWERFKEPLTKMERLELKLTKQQLLENPTAFFNRIRVSKA
jgi:hypothetical protein